MDDIPFFLWFCAFRNLFSTHTAVDFDFKFGDFLKYVYIGILNFKKIK